MKPIAENFKKYGWLHTLVKREGDVAIYRKTKTGDATGAEIESWDVIEVQRHGEIEMHGSIIPAGENYPGSWQWGDAAYSFQTREDAEARFIIPTSQWGAAGRKAA